MLGKPFHAMEEVNGEFMHLLHITLVVKILNEAI
jgi:hypothetical protein